MLHKTLAIVLKYIKYRESSIIVKIYTEQFGLQSYIVNSVRSEKGKYSIALFQPLSILDMVVYHKSKKNTLQRVSEIKVSYPYQHLLYDIKKLSVAIFLSEVLVKALREEEGNTDLFQFLKEALIYLDEAPDQFDNFSPQFLLKFSKYLGFLPTSAQEMFEQLYESNFLQVKPSYFSEEVVLLDKLIRLSFEQPVTISGKQRRDLTDYLLLFYQLHLDDFGEIKSLNILRQILA